MQDVTNPVKTSFYLLHVGYFSPPLLHVLIYFSQDRSKWSSSFFCSTKFKKKHCKAWRRKYILNSNILSPWRLFII